MPLTGVQMNNRPCLKEKKRLLLTKQMAETSYPEAPPYYNLPSFLLHSYCKVMCGTKALPARLGHPVRCATQMNR